MRYMEMLWAIGITEDEQKARRLTPNVRPATDGGTLARTVSNEGN